MALSGQVETCIRIIFHKIQTIFFLKRTDSDKIYSQLFDVSFWGPAMIRIVR